jgi:hypothetical protein
MALFLGPKCYGVNNDEKRAAYKKGSPRLPAGDHLSRLVSRFCRLASADSCVEAFVNHRLGVAVFGQIQRFVFGTPEKQKAQ